MNWMNEATKRTASLKTPNIWPFDMKWGETHFPNTYSTVLIDAQELNSFFA